MHFTDFTILLKSDKVSKNFFKQLKLQPFIIPESFIIYLMSHNNKTKLLQ